MYDAFLACFARSVEKDIRACPSQWQEAIQTVRPKRENKIALGMFCLVLVFF